MQAVGRIKQCLSQVCLRHAEAEPRTQAFHAVFFVGVEKISAIFSTAAKKKLRGRPGLEAS